MPNLCTPQAVLTVAVGAQLLALVLALAGPWAQFWPALGRFSLAAHWTALPAAAALCLTRAALARVHPYLGVVLVLGGLLGIAAAVNLAGAALLGTPRGGVDLARHLALTAVLGCVLLRYLFLAHQTRARALAATQARVQTLQARMQPHFLFNSLNTIAALAGTDPPRAEAATEALARLLRASLQTGDEAIPLAQEVALCRHYLAIEALRLGDRLKVCWEGDDSCASARLPALTLQPLVENAVRHGIEPLAHGGMVRIAIGHDARRLWLEVENPLPMAAHTHGGNHMALDNLRERLHALYGANAALVIHTRDGRHLARIEVPVAMP